MTLTVKCPQCQKPVIWDASSAFKPFCSERCKLIDLGDWASEKHAIPVKDDISEELLDQLGYEEADFFKAPD
ncbi:DNA gyrase inhibitor YacG [Shewanella litorisediminis]|uniref:DNA gyrase inhibitor YacG n=1 Tax=Shewanella litorisediminis TaxID=1173586 RepID=A0ABX7G4E5_9GAMM|nr:DNA gyrase inhibitor YacG [Shewanella litorisediminis]MCL2917731.1 DNA gyrase inhibitor YacG [Shewanella litorisediminis]QRH02176.1 DNA gyrase inhibitor YacG [Shewanella litorisediminis]